MEALFKATRSAFFAISLSVALSYYLSVGGCRQTGDFHDLSISNQSNPIPPPYETHSRNNGVSWSTCTPQFSYIWMIHWNHPWRAWGHHPHTSTNREWRFTKYRTRFLSLSPVQLPSNKATWLGTRELNDSWSFINMFGRENHWTMRTHTHTLHT